MKLSNIGPEASEEKSFEIINIFFHTNVWGPYKCIWKQNWPRRKKIKCQCTTIILATLVDLLSPMICAKIQPEGILCSGEENFQRFLPYMGMVAILVNGPQTLKQAFIPQGGSKWNLSNICPEASEEKSFKILNISPYKSMVSIQIMHREANLTLPYKGQMSMYDHYFGNFGRPPIPYDLCKDSAPRHPWLLRRFLKVTILVNRH